MPPKGNQFKSNSFKDESKPRQGSAKEEPGKRTRPRIELPQFDLRSNGRLIKIIGLFFLILSIFFFIAFTAYLFTWQQDQSYVSHANGGWHNLFKTQQELMDNGVKDPIVDNWMGKLGALLSDQFIYQWFGLASYIFIGIFIIIGYRLLFKIRLLSLTKTLAYSFFCIIFFSIAIGFVHGLISDYPHFLEGEFGYWSNRLLDAQIGQAGTGCLLVFAGLTVLIIAYNIDFKLPERKTKGGLMPSAIGEHGIVPEPVDIEGDIPDPLEWQSNRARFEPLPDNDHVDEERLQQNIIIHKPVVAAELVEAESIVPHTTAHTTVLQNNIMHEPIILTPEPLMEDPAEMEEEEASEIPLTLEIEETRPQAELAIEQETPKTANELVEKFGAFDPKLDLSGYKYPPIDLLENYGSNKISVDAGELEANKNKIVATLNHYNIEIDKIKATIGPTVTLYEIIPAPGVRISKIKNLEDDIALSLAALGIRIIAPMPGKGTIGIEVPNQHPEMVSMRSVLNDRKVPEHYDGPADRSWVKPFQQRSIYCRPG
jgi:S-DNA-T family DNA segregation ATPase FtsK/SpoIIIE